MMRAFAALLLLAGPALADSDTGSIQIDLTRVVAENSGGDWNGDGLPDRLLMVMSDRGDAVDLITFLSDPKADGFAPAEMMPAALPARWPRGAADLYSVTYNLGSGGTDSAHPVLNGVVGPVGYSMKLGRNRGRWVIDHVQTNISQRTADSPPECLMDYAAGKGTGNPYSDAEFDIPASAPPALVPYWWLDILPEVCR